MTQRNGHRPLLSRKARKEQAVDELVLAEEAGGEEDGRGPEGTGPGRGAGGGRRMRRKLDVDGERVKFGLRIHPGLLRAVDLGSYDMDLGKSEFIERAVARYLRDCGYSVPGLEGIEAATGSWGGDSGGDGSG